jgi:branched-subunit amino acid transport protein
MYEILLIGGMFAVTYSIRYLPFAFAHRVELPAWLQQVLEFVPVAALTAIIAPLIVISESELDVSLHNSYLVASIVALLVALKTKRQLVTVFTGLLVFFAHKFA